MSNSDQRTDMQRHRFLLTLGSNCQPEQHITAALSALAALPLELRQSTPRCSQPVDFPLSTAPFTDVVLVGYTELALEELQGLLKALERQLGRTPEQRASRPQDIPIDIDLITWDERLLKPRDSERLYFVEGLRELGISLFER